MNVTKNYHYRVALREEKSFLLQIRNLLCMEQNILSFTSETEGNVSSVDSTNQQLILGPFHV